MNGRKPVVALDIDGTMGDYHGHFLRFAERYLGKKMPHAQDNPGLPLYKFMKISKATYRQTKLSYRQGGEKRSMPCYEDSRELTRHIRKTGAEVWICTTRPYLRLDNIDPDTRHWLRRNGIQYDGVIFGERKYKELCSIVGKDNVLMVVDDLPEQITIADGLGLYTVLRDQPYNRKWFKETKVNTDWAKDIKQVGIIYDHLMRTR